MTLETQEVLVKGSIPFEDLTAKIAKTGKEVRLDYIWHIYLHGTHYNLDSREGGVGMITLRLSELSPGNDVHEILQQHVLKMEEAMYMCRKL